MPNGKVFKIKDKQTGETFTIREKQPSPPSFRFGGGLTRGAGAGGELPQVSPIAKQMSEFERTRKRFAPEALQVIGGIGGGMLGIPLGPVGVAGLSALGGTLGRGVGTLEQMAGGRAPVKEALSSIGGPIGRGIAQFTVLDPEEKQRFGREILRTGAIEAVAAPVGLGISKGVSALGRGITKELLGRRVAERGFTRGFKNMLKPEFYKGRVPKLVATKMNNFFKKLTEVTGKATDRAVTANSITHDISEIKNGVRALLPKSGNPADLLEMTASKAQKNLLNEVTDEILKLKGNKRTTVSLWNLRKKIDNAIFDKRWTDDALNYLYRLRNTLNQPIKNASTEIADSFGRYSFIKEAEKDLGRNFQAITAPNKEIYARKTESFIGNVLSSKKDETLRLLRELDSFLDADDRVIEDLLDVAASETLEEKFGMGIFQKMLVGLLGGKKSIARMGEIIQKPAVQFGKGLFGRFVPTAISAGTKEEAR